MDRDINGARGIFLRALEIDPSAVSCSLRLHRGRPSPVQRWSAFNYRELSLYLVALRRLRYPDELPNGEFMKTVKLTDILEYYDGILLFAACDPIGGNYLGEAIDTVGDHDRYAVVGVRPDRMAEFRAGRVDLRTVMLEAPGGEWYITVADGAIDDPLVLEPQHKPLEENGLPPRRCGLLLEARRAA